VRDAAVRPFSGRRHVNRKILRFSISVGVVGFLLTACVYIASSYPSLVRHRADNLQALSEISCPGATCDTTNFLTDFEWDSPDYVLDTETRFFINMATPTEGDRGRFTPLDYSDTTFLAQFRQPMSYSTPDGEVWRLYSKTVLTEGKKNFEVMVGYRLKAPSEPLATPDSLLSDVDAVVKAEAERLARTLSVPKSAARRSRYDFTGGFQVVDSKTRQVVEQGRWLPAYLPKGVPLPTPGLKFYIYEGSLYVAQTNVNRRLSATSLIEIGELSWILLSCGMGFLFTSVSARALSRRFLRNYFAVTGIRVPSLEEAQRTGEGQSVEFKRGLSDDESKAGSVEEELLKSIAAFANTNDGVIFIGIDDAGHVKGLGLDFAQKDRFERKIRQLIRNRIKPTPPVQITFDSIRDLVIAKVAVARGEAVPFMISGTIYVRYGSSDVQAQPEDVLRLVSQYAF
jgi:hypothetical protein